MKYSKSTSHHDAACELIPTGSMTLSKSSSLFPVGHAPSYCVSSNGTKIVDVDSNEFIDFGSGLLSVILGYGDQDVKGAIVSQLDLGVSFTLPHEIEYEAAKTFLEIVPTAEMVKFFKTGSEATSAAILLARHITGRNNILMGGYHGWHDWAQSKGARGFGVLKEVKTRVDTVEFNDIQDLILKVEENDDLAALIVEPSNFHCETSEFLIEARRLADKYGFLLIFDEMVTGFRLHVGGVQGLYCITPDLSTFGKAIANGMPLSILCGKRKYMSEFSKVFASGTYAGESLSLAAAIACMNKVVDNQVPQKLKEDGVYFLEQLNRNHRAAQRELFFEVGGVPAWQIFSFKNIPEFASSLEIKRYFISRLADMGILWTGSNNYTLAHKKDEIRLLANGMAEITSYLLQLKNDGKRLSDDSSWVNEGINVENVRGN